MHVWRNAHFDRILLSGDGRSTVPMRDFLIAGGIPVAAIRLEDKSSSTRENALFSSQMSAEIPGPYVLLTSDYHMWRAHRAFTKAGLTVTPMPSPDALKRLNDWRSHVGISVDLIEETGKIAYYWARGWI